MPEVIGFPLLVGLDVGGTAMRAAIVSPDGRSKGRFAGPGVNAAVDGPDAAGNAIAGWLAPIVRGRPVSQVVVGIAGGWSSAVARRIARPIRESLPGSRLQVLNDAAASLAANAPDQPALLLAVGTGVVLVGRDPRRPARVVRIDGWGPLAGDAGSGHWLGRAAAEAALAGFDGRGRETRFTRAVRAALGLADPGRDIHRLYAAPRPQAAVAALAPLVLRHARRGDPVARTIVRSAAAAIARSVSTGARRLGGGRIGLFVTGGLAHAAPELLAGLGRLAPRVQRLPATLHQDLDALRLAARAMGLEQHLASSLRRMAAVPVRRATRGPARARVTVTEATNPATSNFSRLSPIAMVRLMNREDLRVAPAVGMILPAVARAVALIERRLRRGGRLIYVGAGTSGRLGVLDASEAPPTFGVPPSLVRAILAGGRRAVTDSVEGAEDRPDLGAAAMRKIRIGPRDAVVGLSVSGGARFVLGAMATARARRAAAIGITCNPGSRLAKVADVALVPRVGPEVIAGSSRLKAGTAQKMLLNMLSTCVMARLGRIEGNLMNHVAPANAKLKLRAIRTLATLARISETEARRRLIRSGWRMPPSGAVDA